MKNIYLFIVFLFLGINTYAQDSGNQHSKLSALDTTCSITIPVTSAIPGDTILIPLDVRNFNDLGAVGLYIKYDTVGLKYLELVNVNSSFGPFYNVKNGVIMLSWMTMANALNLGNTKLFDIQFIYKGGNADITFDLTKCGLTAMSTFEPKYVVYNNGGIVQCPAPYPVASFTYDGSPIFCEGESLILNADINSDYTYKWLKDDVIISGATLTSFTAYQNGNYQLQVTNSHKCNALSDYLSIVVEPLPAIKSTTEIPICGSGTVSLNAVASGGKIYWYDTPNGGTPSATGKIYITPVLTETTTFFVEANSKGCTSPDRVAVVAKINPLPAATVTPSGTTAICSGSSLMLKANTGSGYSYQWQSNGALVVGATASSFTVNAQASYSVIISDVNNCASTSANATVNVNSLPSATATAFGSSSICQGDAVILNGNTASGLKYQWKKGTQNIAGATAYSYTSNTAGDYSVIITNVNNCSNSSNKVTVTVNANPLATITPKSALSFCTGGNVILNANIGAGLAWQWIKDGYFIANATTSAYIADKSGSYSLIISNANKCTTTSTNVTVTVNSPPVPSVTAKSATTFCQGNSVVIAANTAAGITYIWQKDNIDIPAATLSSYTAIASGSYTVIENNSSNCPATSKNVSVVVNPLPSAVITGPTVICSGNNISLSTANVTGYTYQWLRNSINVTGGTSYSYSPKAAGTYSLNITTSALCSATSNSIIVNSYSTPAANITLTGKTASCQGSSLTLTATSGTGYSYQWKKGDVAISGSTASSLSFVNSQPTVSGNYTVVITNVSCSNTSTAVAITVNALPPANITQGTSLSLCQGNAMNLSANTAAGLTYKWKKNNTNIQAATTSDFRLPSSVLTDAANYSVMVSNGTCSNTSAIISVTVNALPPANITQGTSLSLCQGTSMNLSANTGTALTYKWKKNGTDIPGATFINYQLSTINLIDAANYSVLVSNGTCSNTSSNISITVNALPAASISQGAALSLCQGAAMNLSANTGTGLTYKWKKNGTDIPGATFINYQLSTINLIDAANYSVLVSNGTCSNTSSNISITVNALPAASISQGAVLSLCQGAAMNLSANTASGLTYQWKKNNTNIQGATTYDLRLTTCDLIDAANYSVMVSNGTCSNTSLDILVTVNSLPNVELGVDKDLIVDDSLSLNAGSGFKSYQWLKDGSYISAATLSAFNIKNASLSDAGDYSVIVTNFSDCSSSDMIIVSVNKPTAFKISGYLTYDNLKSSPLSNVKVVLINSEGLRIDSVFTDLSGYYVFNNVFDGGYTINAVIAKKWGGADPRDALLINKCFVNLSNYINPFHKIAADVTADNKANASDGLQINKRFVGVITSFKTKDWLVLPQSANVLGSDVTVNFKAICSGDADGSYNPPAKLMSNISLINRGDLYIKNCGKSNSQKQTIEVPVLATEDIQIGALGLIFEMQNTLFRIKDLKSEIAGLVYNVSDDNNNANGYYQQISIAWSANNAPLFIKAGQTLFTLNIDVDISELTSQNTDLNIQLSPSSLLSDFNANSLSNVQFSIPQLKLTINDLGFTTNLMQNYPNPFNNITTIEYSLPQSEFVNISIYNLFGQKISELMNNYQSEGIHAITKDFSDLPAGIYIYRLETNVSSANKIEQKLMIINR